MSFFDEYIKRKKEEEKAKGIDSTNSSVSQFKRNALVSDLESWSQKNTEFMDSYTNRFFDEYDQYKKDEYRADSESALSQATKTKDALEQQRQKLLKDLEQYGSGYGFDEDWLSETKTYLTDVGESYEGVIKAYDQDNKLFSEFANEEEFSGWLQNQKTEEELRGTNLEETQAKITEQQAKLQDLLNIEGEISLLQNQLGNAKFNYNKYQDDETKTEIESLESQIKALNDKRDWMLFMTGNSTQIKERISEYESLYANAKEFQETEALSTNALSDTNFSAVAQQGATWGAEEGFEFYGKDEQRGTYGFFNRPVNDLISYYREDSSRASREAAYEPTRTMERAALFAEQMTDEEYNIYAYYLGKQDFETAQKYLDSIEQDIHYRKANEYYEENLEDANILQQAIFALASAGTNQADTGLHNLLSPSKDKYTTDYRQIAFGKVKEDVEDSFWQTTALDLAHTTGNMLPSILASTALSYFNPTAGRIVGAGLMGASAKGNAYAEAINAGYTKEQASAYSTLIGASETGLSLVLGGISKLGGSVSGKVISNAVSKVDNAFGRFALEMGGKMGSEFTEEYLQEVLDPFFKNIAFGEENDIRFISAEAAYSGFLGALSAGVLEGPGTVTSFANTYSQGEKLSQSGVTGETLKKVALDSKLSADSVADKLAGRVNENTKAYTLGRMFQELNAEITEQNKADIKFALENKGVDSKSAAKIANWMQNFVAGAELTAEQKQILDMNNDISEVMQDVLYQKNTTVLQRQMGIDSIRDQVAAHEIEQRLKKLVSKKAKAKTQQQSDTGDIETKTDDSSTETTKPEYTVSESDTTFNKKTGNDIVVTGIKSAKNKTLTTQDGETVNIKDVSFATEKEAVVYNMVMKKDLPTEVANIMIETALSANTENVSDFLFSAELAYKYGYLGAKEADVMLDADARAISSELGKRFYKLGKEMAKTETSKEQTEIDSKKAQKSESKTKKKGRVTFDGKELSKEFEDSLTDIQRESIKGIKVIAEVLGNDVNLFASYIAKEGKYKGRRVYRDSNGHVKLSPNGFYNPDGSINLDINSGNLGEGTMLYTLSHELTHHIRKWSPAKFKVLADFVVQEYIDSKVDVVSLVQRQIDKAKNEGRVLTFDGAYEEMIADACSTMLLDSNAIEKLAQKDKTLFEKIKSFIKDFIDKINKLYKNFSPDAKEAQYVKDIKGMTDKLQALWFEGLEDAGDVYAIVKEGKTKEFNEGKFSLRESVEETKDLVAVHNLSEEKLLKSLQLGGLPMPSIAIIRAKEGHENFGTISLVFGKETIDPQFFRSNKVYSGDAWTPTYPRVEYKIDENVVEKGVDEVEHLIKSRGFGKDDFGYLSSISEDSFKYGNTEEVANKTALKVAYLIDKGIDFKPVYKEGQLSDFGRFDNFVVKNIAEALGKERIVELHNNSEGVKSAVEEIRNLANEYKANKYKDNEKLFAELSKNPFYGENNFGFSQAHEIVEGAYKYFNNGSRTKIDEWETKNEIADLIDKTDYKKWINNLFDGFIAKEGIRNNKDLFTPSGNRRSFEALHYEHNLENVIKAMKEEGTKGVGAFGGGNIFGASTTEISSIADIKNNAEKRLRSLSDEEFSEIKKGFADRFFELASSLPNNKDSFTATDDAANVLVEAISKHKTKSGIANYIRKECQGWATYSDYVVDDLIELVSDIQQMPTKYFEAKPQRAVGFDEVKAVVIPDNSSAELKSALKSKSFNVLEYQSGNEQDRTAVLNSIEDVKFSGRDSEGNTLSKEQQEFFEDSKVRDKDGNLLVMYHGTPNAGFTKFKSGTYFTQYKWYANRYQSQGASSLGVKKTANNPDTYAVYLNIKKPFDTRNKTERDIFYNEYYRQWGIGTDLMESGLPDWMDGIDLQEFLEENGYDYDGLILDEGGVGGYGEEVKSRGLSYVAFSSEQVKNIDNKAPTSDPDIRFSDRDSVDSLLERRTSIQSKLDELRKTRKELESSDEFNNLISDLLSAEKETEKTKSINEYNSWTAKTKYDEIVNEIESLQKEYSEINRIISERVKQKAVEDERKKIAESGLSDADYFRKSAIKEFGYTPYFYDAGYMLPDGKLLNFSGEKGKHFGSRGQDHRAIEAVYADVSRGKAMLKFMSEGNIRVMAETPGLDISSVVEPTSKQYTVIKKFAREYAKEKYLAVDITDENGKVIGTYGYENNINADRVVNDIKYYFQNGAMREQSSVSRFFYSERDSDGGFSNRYLLANALESTAKTAEDKKKLVEYKAKLGKLSEAQQRLQDVNAKIKEISFSKGERDKVKLAELQKTSKELNNLINRYDKKLFDLESTESLKQVLEREKEAAYKKATQEGKDALTAYKEKSKQKEQGIKEHYQELRDRAKERKEKTNLRHKIQKKVQDLHNLYAHGTRERNVNIGLQRAVAEAVAAINGDTVKLEKLRKIYADIRAKKTDSDFPKYFAEEAAIIELEVEKTIDAVGDTPLSKMSLAQLDQVNKMYAMVLTTIRNSNKIWRQNKLEDLRARVDKVTTEVRSLPALKEERATQFGKVREYIWNELIPVYAFERIGSKAFTELFWDAIEGMNTWARDIDESNSFAEATREKHGFSSWDLNKVYNIELENGKTMNLTLEHMMSIYAYSKRKQAERHMTTGGFFFDDNETFTVKKGVMQVTKSSETSYKVSFNDMRTITQKMNEVAKGSLEYVDEMQAYLSDVMAAKGNEVSVLLWGIELFKEKIYFPLKSKKDFRMQANTPSQASSLKNDGMTKETVPNANNPIVLQKFDNVWANHINRMSMYHGFVMPIENLNKVFSYGTWLDGEARAVSTVIESRHSKAAVNYISKFIDDLNGNVLSEGARNPLSGFFTKAKKTTVAMSGSTVAQQPTAIIRAMALINPVHFVGKPDIHILKKYEQIKKHAPIAYVKEMGGFEAGSGRRVQDIINESLKIGWDKAKQKIDDFAMFGATMGDVVGWCMIWDAVEREVKANNKNIKVGSQEYFNLVSKRFTEVIVYTQVFDSTLSRSGFMRSNSEIMKMLTAYGGEPTVTINMMLDAILKAKRGGKKAQAARTIAVTYLATIAAAAAASAYYALRDDDEDETYLEKFAEAWADKMFGLYGLTGELNPLTQLPAIKDIISIFEGWDVERMDTAIFKDLKDAFITLDSERKTTWRKVEDFAGAIGALFGIPVKNTLRTAREIYNGFKLAFSDAESDGFGAAFVRGITGEEKPKGDTDDDEGSSAKRETTYTTTEIKEALENEDKAEAVKMIEVLVSEKAEYYMEDDEELTEKEATKKAESSVKSSLTQYLKPLYIEAYKSKDQAKIRNLRYLMRDLKVYGSVGDIINTCQNWIKNSK